jgi:hypothetical protein
MSALSRRSLVASAAALPALAVPAIAEQIQEPRTGTADPIFAAIEVHQKAVEAENAAYAIRRDAQEAFLAKYGTLRPDGLSKEARDGLAANIDPRFADARLRDHEEISRLRTIEWITPDVRALFHRELNHQQAAYDATVQPAEDAADAAFEKRWDAQQVVFATVPTTLAGFRAKIDFAMSADFVTESLTSTDTDDPFGNFLETLYKSAQCLTAS